MGALDGLTALVTGCGRYQGLGRGIALALAGAGADVAVNDLAPAGSRNAAEGITVEDEIGWMGLASLVEEIEALDRRALAVVGDVGDSDDVARMVDEVADGLGPVDILVNNAGAPHGADRGLTWEVPPDAFADVLRTNTTGVFLMSSAVTRQLLGRRAPGRIINISSVAGIRGFPRRAAYCASKFAVHGITQTMALELAPHGITVNAVAPGAMDTSRQSSRVGRADEGAGADVLPPAVPVGRIGVPQDIARAVVFLADPAASYITGQIVAVDGGVGLS